MRVPTRRYDKQAEKPDPYLTQAKYDELSAKLRQLIEVGRPKAAAEVRRLAEMGDFSENAAYQIAKGKLRGINQRILSLETHLKTAEIIRAKPGASVVTLGATVEVSNGQTKRRYTILGSAESDPAQGIISRQSPLGAALLGAQLGQTVRVKTLKGETEYQVLKIE